MLTVLLLSLTALITSTVAGVIGLGGGMLLIAVLPVYLPPAAVVPVHGITQLASNSSRTLFALRAVEWRFVPQFVFGSLVGIAVVTLLLLNIPTRYIPVFIGSYILLSLWLPTFNQLVKRYETFYLAGAFQSGLGLLVGATGPLTTTLLTKQQLDKDRIVATNALFMSFSHFCKIIVFGIIGFSFGQYGWLMVGMIIGAILGSYIGTQLRRRIDGKRFVWVLKLVLTALAVRMLYGALLS